MATIDHVLPRSRGGLDNEKNMVMACFKCNSTLDSSIKNNFQIEYAKRLAEAIIATNPFFQVIEY
jgi:5-methylcytosine-specific restriction endonuclease McrA